ncbi:MAG: RNA polymerase sigma factor [Actinomycetota bacterium]|nr:RNA polymerase sigma factor [Actinomycetota bacterium]
MLVRREDRFGKGFDGVLAAAQEGAGWAFERLWQTFAPSVTGYLRLQGAAEPDDLASEVFLGAFQSLATFSGDEAAFRSWLFTIAHRRLVDARRRAARRPPPQPLAEGHDTGHAAAPEVEMMRRMAEERVRSLCRQLVPEQRDVLLLRLVGGFTVEEVAATLDKSPGATKALQRRGLVALRKILEREGVPL